MHAFNRYVYGRELTRSSFEKYLRTTFEGCHYAKWACVSELVLFADEPINFAIDLSFRVSQKRNTTTSVCLIAICLGAQAVPLRPLTVVQPIEVAMRDESAERW